MPIQPIQYQPTTQFQPVNSFLSTYATVKQMQAAKDEMESAKMRNRLYAMQLKEAETNQAFKNELANSLLAPQTVKDITLTQPAQLSQVPLQSPGGVLATQQRTPSGGISENTPAAPIVAPAQALKMTGLTGEIPSEMTGTPGVLADIQERQITPLIEQAKQFGIPEAAVRSNPAAALEFIEKKKAETQAVLDKKITMVKNLAAVNPKMAEDFWNSNPDLKAMGEYGEQSMSEPVIDTQGNVIGHRVPVGGGKYQVVKPSGEGAPSDYKTFYRGYKQEHPGATDAEISRAWEQRKIDTERAKVQARAEENLSFSTWTDDDKIPFFETHLTQGQPTVKFAFGDRQSWNQYNKEFSKFLTDRGLSGADISLARTEFDSLKSSMLQQQKNIGAMGGYVRNIEKQLDRLDVLMATGEGESGKNKKAFVDRFGLRALDIPIRELRKKAIGSGDEVILEAYMVEISNEIGKLSTGSSASVRELSVDAQERWAKIHDPNLSMRTHLKKVLDETRHMGRIRMEGAHQELEFTKDQVRGLSQRGKGELRPVSERFLADVEKKRGKEEAGTTKPVSITEQRRGGAQPNLDMFWK